MRTTMFGLVLGLMFLVALAERAEAQFGGISFSIGGGSSRVQVGIGTGGYYGGGFNTNRYAGNYISPSNFGYVGGGYGGRFNTNPIAGNYISPSNFGYGEGRYRGGVPDHAIPAQRVHIHGGAGRHFRNRGRY